MSQSSLVNKPYIMLCTPCYGGVMHEAYFHSVVKLLQEAATKLTISRAVCLNVVRRIHSLIKLPDCFYWAKACPAEVARSPQSLGSNPFSDKNPEYSEPHIDSWTCPTPFFA